LCGWISGQFAHGLFRLLPCWCSQQSKARSCRTGGALGFYNVYGERVSGAGLANIKTGGIRQTLRVGALKFYIFCGDGASCVSVHGSQTIELLLSWIKVCLHISLGMQFLVVSNFVRHRGQTIYCHQCQHSGPWRDFLH